MSHILLRHRDIKDIHRYSVYASNGGYEGLKKALSGGEMGIHSEGGGDQVRCC